MTLVESRAHEIQSVRQRIEGSQNGTTPEHAPPRFQVIDDATIEQRPKPEYLVDELLPQGAPCVLYGSPESAKSFFALALAFSVATGVSLFGRGVARGRAVFVAAEGSGAWARVATWKESHERYERAGVGFVTEPVLLLDRHDVTELIAALDDPEPLRLIVLDTLAWCMVGGDENSAQDMGLAIAGMRRIQRETGACVMAIHHSGKDKSAERGSSSLRGGVETMLELRREGDLITVHCEKQKDDAKFADFVLRLVEVGDSCALITAESGPAVIDPLRMLEAIQALRSVHSSAPPDEGLSTGAWFRVSGLKERTFYERRKSLLSRLRRVSREKATGAQLRDAVRQGCRHCKLQHHCAMTAPQLSPTLAASLHAPTPPRRGAVSSDERQAHTVDTSSLAVAAGSSTVYLP